MAKILVVDDDPGFRKLLRTILVGEDYEVETAATATEGRRIGSRTKFDLVLTDLKLPDGTGMDVLKFFFERTPDLPVILLTGFGTVSTAVEAMKLGAVDYLEKPLRSPDELRKLVRNALARRSSATRPATSVEGFACDMMIARDPKMLRLIELARRVAPTNATVLLMGESGTGKEVLARCIHRNSLRAGQVFLALNCAALAPTLIESELFGHEKGSFTGAVHQHAGVFERADGGTLFLDEIGELDGCLQSKLLRVLQERSFERVGGTKTLTVDVRLIAATNRDLKKHAAEGKFRDDLYYRLNTFPLELPPLRERQSDVAAMARFFLGRAARNLGKVEPRISETALSTLMAYRWPGNIRELENLMERVAILTDGEVDEADLPLPGEEDQQVPVTMRDIERRSIEEALRANDGNRTRAAKQLGISLRTLQYRLKEYGIGGDR